MTHSMSYTRSNTIRTRRIQLAGIGVTNSLLTQDGCKSQQVRGCRTYPIHVLPKPKPYVQPLRQSDHTQETQSRDIPVTYHGKHTWSSYRT